LLGDKTIEDSARLTFVLPTDFRRFEERRRTVTARFLLVVSDDLKKQMQRLPRKNGMAPARWARLACAYAIENRSPVIDVVDPVKRPGRPRRILDLSMPAAA
jgi:hypothetical protein